jgi:GNAT superfamily N-acetyltransferase
MQIVNFGMEHIEEAERIALECYEQERLHNPDLPRIEKLPELSCFVRFGLGIAAIDRQKQLAGYLCAYPPVEDAFATTGVRGTYVPIHAHGVRSDLTEKEKRRLYSLMYQAAADKWVRAGIVSHGIGLYAHDRAAEQSFFYNGFGIRCIDAIRSLDEIPTKTVTILEGDRICCLELPREEWGGLLGLHNALRSHLGQSPTFMKFQDVSVEWLYQDAPEGTRYFAAEYDGSYIAYIKLGRHGETFVSETDSMMNICGAYCLPEFRGTGLYHNLLAYVAATLKREGYRLLGVDCESINPNALGFWLKYFSDYTHSVVRRIDDKAV